MDKPKLADRPWIVIIGVISSGFAIITFFTGWENITRAYPSIVSAIKTIGSHLMQPRSFRVWHYSVLLLNAIPFAALLIFRRLSWLLARLNTQAVFHGIKWQWDYPTKGLWIPASHVNAYCVICGIALKVSEKGTQRDGSDMTIFQCPNEACEHYQEEISFHGGSYTVKSAIIYQIEQERHAFSDWAAEIVQQIQHTSRHSFVKGLTIVVLILFVAISVYFWPVIIGSAHGILSTMAPFLMRILPLPTGAVSVFIGISLPLLIYNVWLLRAATGLWRYRSDWFHNLKWEWDYYGWDNSVVGPWPVCSTCRTELTSRFIGYVDVETVYCCMNEICPRQGEIARIHDASDLRQEVQRTIEEYIQSGQYKTQLKLQRACR